MNKMQTIDDVAFALVNYKRNKHGVPEFKSIESMLENLTPEGLQEYRDMASIAIQAYNATLDAR